MQIFFVIEAQILNNDVFLNDYSLTVTLICPYGIGTDTSVNFYGGELNFNFFNV